MKTKFMTLMTVATLGIFSAATVMAAGNNDFYTQPPTGSEWEKADTEGTYASYTNGNDYVNIYKYSLVFRGEDGAFNRFFKEWDAILRHANNTLSGEMNLDKIGLSRINTGRPLLISGQRLMIESVKYTLPLQ